MPLDIKKDVEQLRKMYRESPSQRTFKALITGETGSGKTYLLRTCPLPVHIDSFDPGGTKCLLEDIEKGHIIPDIRYEGENPAKPRMFKEWEAQTKDRIRSGYFDHISTYALDSSTFWAEAIINNLMGPRSGEQPKWSEDYAPQRYEINKWLRVLIDLPCNVVVTGHLEPIYDKDKRITKMRYMTVGKGAILFPLLFDEIYVCLSKPEARGVTYTLLTQRTGLFLAATRLGRGGKFEMYEKPDIKALLKKAGLESKDKPLI